MAAVTFYMSGKAKRLKTLGQLISQETLNSVRRATRKLRNEVHAEYIKRGVGRALSEGRGTRRLGPHSLKTIIKAYTKASKGQILTGVHIKGTAALVAQGGRTVAHDISPSRAKFLNQRNGGAADKKAMWRRIEFQKLTGNGSFGLAGALSNINTPNAGKAFFSGRTVHHPGSQFVKDDFIGRASFRAYPIFEMEVEKGLKKVAEIASNAA